MRRYLFCGPSLPDTHQQLADGQIRVMPPVAAGDLLRMPLDPGDLVGIVDGYFHQTRAVRHKEILAVLSQGVRVFGAASIGALRAAEMDRFGMVGVGRIYRDYRDGRLEADDEVALVHGEADIEYQHASVPLVNIRATLADAERHGLLDAGARDGIIQMLARLPYPRRSYRTTARVAVAVGMGALQVQELQRFCREHPVDVKRADALRLADILRDPPAQTDRIRHRLNRTRYLYGWQVEAAGNDRGGVSDLAVLRACQVLARDYPDIHRQLVLNHLVADCLRSCGPVVGTDPVDIAIAHGVHRGLFPPISEVSGFDFMAPWLTRHERLSDDFRQQITAFLVRSFRIPPGVVDDEAAMAAAGEAYAEPARAMVRAAYAMNEQARKLNPKFQLESLREERVMEWVCDRWCAEPDELELHALDRGLDSVPMVLAVARPVYLLAKYQPDKAELRLP
jgi:hypothetical protein